MNNQRITLRWSSLYAFMKCQRKYRLAYKEGWRRRVSSESRALILGSAIHAGIQDALNLIHYAPESDAAALTAAARQGARDWLARHHDPDKQVYDWDRREWVPDEEYDLMMRDVEVQALNVLAYQIPRIGLGTKYRVPTVAEVIGRDPEFCYTCETYGAVDAGRCEVCGADSTLNLPAIEWQFSEVFRLENGNEYEITGTIDTVLQDIETGEYIVADWKSRANIPPERLIDLDGQLKLYGAIINHMAGYPVITKTLQYQMRTLVPKPARITEKKRQVSVASISSTWEVWSESVRQLGLDPEQYREQMEPKLHPPEHFTLAVFTPITPIGNKLAIDNALRIGEAIRFAETTGSFPGIPHSMGCQFCGFKNYCRTLEVGGDTETVLAMDYEQGEFDAFEDDVEEA